MLKQRDLDVVFHALADPTRRGMVERLISGAMTVSELAEPFSMSLSAVTQHLSLLEESGLVRSRKEGRVRTVELNARRLEAAERWFTQHRERWHRRLDRLGRLLDEENES